MMEENNLGLEDLLTQFSLDDSDIDYRKIDIGASCEPTILPSLTAPLVTNVDCFWDLTDVRGDRGTKIINCGAITAATTGLSKCQNVYVFYDVSSVGSAHATCAKNALDNFFTNYRTANTDWLGRVFHIPTYGERWINTAYYPYAGELDSVWHDGGNQSTTNAYDSLPIDTTGISGRYSTTALALASSIAGYGTFSVLPPGTDYRCFHTDGAVNSEIPWLTRKAYWGNTIQYDEGDQGFVDAEHNWTDYNSAGNDGVKADWYVTGNTTDYTSQRIWTGATRNYSGITGRMIEDDSPSFGMVTDWIRIPFTATTGNSITISLSAYTGDIQSSWCFPARNNSDPISTYGNHGIYTYSGNLDGHNWNLGAVLNMSATTGTYTGSTTGWTGESSLINNVFTGWVFHSGTTLTYGGDNELPTWTEFDAYTLKDIYSGCSWTALTGDTCTSGGTSVTGHTWAITGFTALQITGFTAVSGYTSVISGFTSTNTFGSGNTENICWDLLCLKNCCADGTNDLDANSSVWETGSCFDCDYMGAEADTDSRIKPGHEETRFSGGCNPHDSYVHFSTGHTSFFSGFTITSTFDNESGWAATNSSLGAAREVTAVAGTLLYNAQAWKADCDIWKGGDRNPFVIETFDEVAGRVGADGGLRSSGDNDSYWDGVNNIQTNTNFLSGNQSGYHAPGNTCNGVAGNAVFWGTNYGTPFKVYDDGSGSGNGVSTTAQANANWNATPITFQPEDYTSAINYYNQDACALSLSVPTNVWKRDVDLFHRLLPYYGESQFAGFVYPVNSSTWMARSHFVLHTLGAIEGETMNEEDIRENPTVTCKGGSLNSIAYTNPYEHNIPQQYDKPDPIIPYTPWNDKTASGLINRIGIGGSDFVWNQWTGPLRNGFMQGTLGTAPHSGLKHFGWGINTTVGGSGTTGHDISSCADNPAAAAAASRAFNQGLEIGGGALGVWTINTSTVCDIFSGDTMDNDLSDFLTASTQYRYHITSGCTECQCLPAVFRNVKGPVVPPSGGDGVNPDDPDPGNPVVIHNICGPHASSRLTSQLPGSSLPGVGRYGAQQLPAMRLIGREELSGLGGVIVDFDIELQPFAYTDENDNIKTDYDVRMVNMSTLNGELINESVANFVWIVRPGTRRDQNGNTLTVGCPTKHATDILSSYNKQQSQFFLNSFRRKTTTNNSNKLNELYKTLNGINWDKGIKDKQENKIKCSRYCWDLLQSSGLDSSEYMKGFKECQAICEDNRTNKANLTDLINNSEPVSTYWNNYREEYCVTFAFIINNQIYSKQKRFRVDGDENFGWMLNIVSN